MSPRKRIPPAQAPAATDTLESLRARCARLERLYQVSNRIHSTLDPQEALTLIVTEAVRFMNASSGSLALVNPNTNLLEIHASCGRSDDDAPVVPLKIGEGVTGWVASTGRAARVDDVTQDPRYVKVRAETRSELAVPLEVNGETRGVLNVDSDRLAGFSAEDEALLVELATQAAKVIHNTWLYEQLRLKARLFEALSRVGQVINSTVNVNEALQVIVRETCQLMRAKVCSLMLLDQSRTRLELQASHGAGTAYRHKPPLEVAESMLGVVVRRRRPLQIDNVQTSSRYQNIAVAIEEGLVSLLSVPLMFSGEAIGTLTIYTAQPYHFSNEEIQILSALAELSAVAIEKARLYERAVDVEEQLRRNEKLSALGLLAAEVAHEIRNPLTVMKMLYHSLDLRFPEPDARAKDARLIGEKMEHLNRIVERVLDLSRNAEPSFSRVNLNALVEELGLLVRHKLRNQAITLVPQLDPALPDIVADATQIEQVLLNLMLNAMEAMPAGGRLTLRTSPVPAPGGAEGPGWVRFQVEDTGQGMCREDREKAFTSLLNTTKAGGTGLGLAIVGRIVEAHRGTIEVQSEPGAGTVVTVCLPGF
ncbi:MAG: GAF domain-containing protein [Verrucomicrobia bacterium]|jgi:signal transduction histidine kinase|nr:GAF domain-containing protein [Verrucomicrobiota bacterium]